MKKADVDLEKCQGHGKCYMVAPEMFDYADDHGRAEYVGGPIGPDDTERMEQVERAAESCPEYAITIVDDDTGESA